MKRSVNTAERMFLFPLDVRIATDTFASSTDYQKIMLAQNHGERGFPVQKADLDWFRTRFLFHIDQDQSPGFSGLAQEKLNT